MRTCKKEFLIIPKQRFWGNELCSNILPNHSFKFPYKYIYFILCNRLCVSRLETYLLFPIPLQIFSTSHKFVLFCTTQQPRMPPPSYEEALSSRVSNLRLTNRSQSEERTMATGGGHSTPPPPFRLRNNMSGTSSRMLTRTRAEDIPDIYWEQAARELDFCTCRKCQVFLGEKLLSVLMRTSCVLVCCF